MADVLALGTTTFSLTPEWRAGAGLVPVVERLAASGCGPAIEVIGHQVWRGFPEISARDEHEFRDAVERLGLRPVALGVYTHLHRWPGRVMTPEQAMDDLRPQLLAAARLGFPLVRATLGMHPALLSLAAAEAERLGLVLTFEVQGNVTPDAPGVMAVLDLCERTGSPYLGLTLDFSLTTVALPKSLATAMLRAGLDDADVTAVGEAWLMDASAPDRVDAAAAVVIGGRGGAALSNLVAGVVGRCGRQRASDWDEVLPFVHHAHAKLWDADVDLVRSSHGEWLDRLAAAGYGGAVVSEWGGHELVDRADADALTVTSTHLAMLRELIEPGIEVSA